MHMVAVTVHKSELHTLKNQHDNICLH